MKKVIAIALSLLMVCAMVLSVSAETQYRDEALPTEYTQVEYLESTSQQLIETGIFPNLDTQIEVKFQVTSSAAGGYSGTAGIMGVNNSGQGSTSTINIAYKPGASNFTFRVGGTSANLCTSVQKDHEIHTVEVNTASSSMYFDGTMIIGSGAATYAAKTTDPCITMFGVRYKKVTDSSAVGSNIGAMSYVRIFYAKIWQDGQLVRDYIPAVNAQGVAGMYDKVTKTFFTDCRAENVAPFITGAVVEAKQEPSPATSDGTVYAIAGIVIASIGMTAAVVIRKKED